MTDTALAQRYDLDEGGFLGERGHMAPDEHGDWVSYSDYASLRDANKALTGERDELLVDFRTLNKRALAAEAKLATVEATFDKLVADRDFEQSSRLTSEAQLGTIISNLNADRDRLSAELAEAQTRLERASILVHLVTVRQVIDAGDRAINASGLNPWCLNEGLADGSECISPSFLASKEASHAE